MCTETGPSRLDYTKITPISLDFPHGHTEPAPWHFLEPSHSKEGYLPVYTCNYGTVHFLHIYKSRQYLSSLETSICLWWRASFIEWLVEDLTCVILFC